MKKTLLATAAAALLGFGTSASAMPTYNPVGPQVNVGIGTVTGGGWRLCHSEAMGTYDTSIAGIAAACDGDLMMLAGGLANSQELSVLSWANETDVMFVTGGSNTTHAANGTEWYFDPSWSWGFAPAGAAVSLNSCDTNDSSWTGGGPTQTQRLCIHTWGGFLAGGWRVGAADGLNSSTDYMRYWFTADSNGNDIPEPASLALLGAGLFGLGVSRRRKAAAR